MTRHSLIRVSVFFAVLFSAAPALAQPDAGPAPDLAILDAGPAPDFFLWPDLTIFDYSVPDGIPTSCAQVIGQPCTSGGPECGSAGTCMLISTSAGICTCACTPDDPMTPLVNEDSCPDLSQHRCGRLSFTGGASQYFCFKLCQPKLGSDECPGSTSCLPYAGIYAGIWDATICLFEGCTQDSDCPVSTGQSCTVGTAGACGANEQCISLAEGSAIGICAKDGNCDKASGLCDKHTPNNPAAKVGDPCKGDVDCGPYMSCTVEHDPKALGGKDHGDSCSDDAQCCGGTCNLGKCEGVCSVRVRNGYCSVEGCGSATSTDFSEFSCPPGSSCNRMYPGGMCQKTCSLANAIDCRGHSGDLFGDYECRAWDGLTIAGIQISSGPVCDFGYALPCSTWANSPISCSDLGDRPGNATNMSCRKLDNTQTANPYDPEGFCLDDTASGPVTAAPDAGPPGDGGVYDTLRDDLNWVPDWSSIDPDSAPSKADGAIEPKKDDGGCGCRTAATGDDAGGLLLLGLGLLVLIRRRRR